MMPRMTKGGAGTRLLTTIFYTVLAVLLVGYLALPYLVKQYLPSVFARHGLEFAVDSVKHDILGANAGGKLF